MADSSSKNWYRRKYSERKGSGGSWSSWYWHYNFEPSKQLDVRGDVIVSGELTVGDTTFGEDFSTRNLSVSGVSTFTGAIDANGSLDVDGHTELDDVNVSGASTFTGAIDANGSLDVDGHTELDDVSKCSGELLQLHLLVT